MAKLLKVVFAPKFKKQFKKFPVVQKKKFEKQLRFLSENFRHPSLKARKMRSRGCFEAKVNYHYRFTYRIEKNELWILTIGPHDKGLGKK